MLELLTRGSTNVPVPAGSAQVTERTHQRLHPDHFPVPMQGAKRYQVRQQRKRWSLHHHPANVFERFRRDGHDHDDTKVSGARLRRQPQFQQQVFHRRRRPADHGLDRGAAKLPATHG
uniref:(northern house mosquito) hypothetical protein n=1 Tax=Culex pipiens TaxID=7175 RepID=A0A8D8D2U1_CULPI